MKIHAIAISAMIVTAPVGTALAQIYMTTDYPIMTVAAIMAEGNSIVGKKVEVMGFVFYNDDDAAIVVMRPDDTRGLIVDIRTAPTDLRRYIFDKCNNIHFRCHIDVHGTVVSAATGSGVYVKAE